MVQASGCAKAAVTTRGEGASRVGNELSANRYVDGMASKWHAREEVYTHQMSARRLHAQDALSTKSFTIFDWAALRFSTIKQEPLASIL